MAKKKKKTNIDKSKLAVAITISIMCFIIVYVICIQFKTVEKIDVSEIETMRENELRDSLATWKESYQEALQKLTETNIKIAEYHNKMEMNEEAGELLEEELEKAKMLLGLTDVQGNGIIITIIDNDETEVISTDLLDLVNELNSAGAEAISINNQRIVSMTDIVDVDEFVMINGRRIASPYTIKTIGDLTYLQSALNIKGGYLDKYKTNGYTITFETNDEVSINKYDNEMTLDYID